MNIINVLSTLRRLRDNENISQKDANDLTDVICYLEKNKQNLKFQEDYFHDPSQTETRLNEHNFWMRAPE